jgi:hypothetical protein
MTDAKSPFEWRQSEPSYEVVTRKRTYRVRWLINCVCLLSGAVPVCLAWKTLLADNVLLPLTDNFIHYAIDCLSPVVRWTIIRIFKIIVCMHRFWIYEQAYHVFQTSLGLENFSKTFSFINLMTIKIFVFCFPTCLKRQKDVTWLP